MPENVNVNFRKASDAVFMSGLLGVANFILIANFSSASDIIPGVISVGSVFLLGFFLRRGSERAKWIYVFFFTLGLLGFLVFNVFVAIYNIGVLPFGISLLQAILQAIAVVFLFLPSTKQLMTEDNTTKAFDTLDE